MSLLSLELFFFVLHLELGQIFGIYDPDNLTYNLKGNSILLAKGLLRLFHNIYDDF